MESKQWSYSWFGKPRKVRDTAESILTVMNRVSGIVSIGMSSAPPFVSLPWSMAISIVSLVMSDFDSVNSAVDGLKEVTGLLANHSYAEREYLLNSATKQNYENIVLPLYASIFAYQAQIAQYFFKKYFENVGYQYDDKSILAKFSREGSGTATVVLNTFERTWCSPRPEKIQ